MQNYHNTVNAE